MVRIVTDKRHAGADPNAAGRLEPVFYGKVMAKPSESYAQDGLISSETPSLEDQRVVRLISSVIRKVF